jgi:hypothetical protein
MSRLKVEVTYIVVFCSLSSTVLCKPLEKVLSLLKNKNNNNEHFHPIAFHPMKD